MNINLKCKIFNDLFSAREDGDENIKEENEGTRNFLNSEKFYGSTDSNKLGARKKRKNSRKERKMFRKELFRKISCENTYFHFKYYSDFFVETKGALEGKKGFREKRIKKKKIEHNLTLPPSYSPARTFSRNDENLPNLIQKISTRVLRIRMSGKKTVNIYEWTSHAPSKTAIR